jgi:hypothetical protein
MRACALPFSIGRRYIFYHIRTELMRHLFTAVQIWIRKAEKAQAQAGRSALAGPRSGHGLCGGGFEHIR